VDKNTNIDKDTKLWCCNLHQEPTFVPSTWDYGG